MPPVANIRQAVDDAAFLFDRTKYQSADKINEIARRLLAQALVLELRDAHKLSYVQIGLGVGVGEKTIRYNYLSAKNCPTDEHLVNLAKFYRKVVSR